MIVCVFRIEIINTHRKLLIFQILNVFLLVIQLECISISVSSVAAWSRKLRTLQTLRGLHTEWTIPTRPAGTKSEHTDQTTKGDKTCYWERQKQ